MDYEQFKEEVKATIKAYLPEKYEDAEINIVQVTKNNDQKLDGLTIRSKDSAVTPTIYINGMFDRMQNGEKMSDIMREIADLHLNHENAVGIDVSKILDYEKAKENITCRLVNAEQNAEYLKDKPYTQIEDLAITYHIKVNDGPEGLMTSPITDKLMKQYGVTKDDIHKVAMENLERLTPPKFVSMQEMMMEIMLPDKSDPNYDIMKQALTEQIGGADNLMYVLTNENKVNGAVLALDQNIMDKIAEKVGGDFYVLPSSVHEVLVVPKRADMDVKELEHMVQEVNATQVAVEEQLSDHVYMYDAKEHEFLRADKAEAREQKSPEHESPNMEKGCMSMDGWSAGIEKQKSAQNKVTPANERSADRSKNMGGRD